ncbi:MAG: DUF1330 domain-containing protein [Granulosicoccus sp.]|nr:DUF1330 domain-containing protein [Granulosicoccus sp.]
MPAYWVARSKIIDPVAYKRYTDRVPGIISQYGGKVLARGGDFKILEGTDKFHRFIVIEFPSIADGEACFHSDDYQDAASNRRDGAGEVDLILVEGGDATV